MRICDLTNFYHEKSGGVKTYLHQKMAYIARSRSDEHLVIVPGSVNSEKRCHKSIICQVKAPELPFTQSYRLITNIRRLDLLIRQFRPDIIEAGCPYLLPWLVATRKRYGCRLAGFYHSDFPRAYVRTTSRIIGKIPAALLEKGAFAYVRAMYRQMDLTLAPSSASAAMLAARGIAGVQTVPLGVDLENFHPRYRRLSLRLRLGLTPERVLLLYVGRFTREKGLDVLKQAFEDLAGRYPDRYHLLLVGEGPLGAELKEWSAGRSDVTVEGYLQGKQLAEVYASADLFVTCGWAETFGLAVLEAQAAGLPVVAAASGAVPQTVAKKAGMIVPPNDPVSLAAAIASISNQDLRDMGRLTRQYVEVNYGWEKSFSKLFGLYEKLLGNQ